jgi:hypothetical protein
MDSSTRKDDSIIGARLGEEQSDLFDMVLELKGRIETLEAVALLQKARIAILTDKVDEPYRKRKGRDFRLEAAEQHERRLAPRSINPSEPKEVEPPREFFTITDTTGRWYFDVDWLADESYVKFLKTCPEEEIKNIRDDMVLGVTPGTGLWETQPRCSMLFILYLIMKGKVSFVIDKPTHVSDENLVSYVKEKYLKKIVPHIKAEFARLSLQPPSAYLRSSVWTLPDGKTKSVKFTLRVKEGTKGFNMMKKMVFYERGSDKPEGEKYHDWNLCRHGQYFFSTLEWADKDW